MFFNRKPNETLQSVLDWHIKKYQNFNFQDAKDAFALAFKDFDNVDGKKDKIHEIVNLFITAVGIGRFDLLTSARAFAMVESSAQKIRMTHKKLMDAIIIRMQINRKELKG